MVTVTGPYDATATLASSADWLIQMVAFRAGASGPDTQPPSAPANLTATTVSTSQINLGWTAALDNVGVTGYLIERCQGPGCSSFAQVATSASASFSDTGLNQGTSYSYRVRAADAAGNLSSYSSVATAATIGSDTQPPTAPSALVATVVSSAQINLAWTGSTDNVGVAGYSVERCQGARAPPSLRLGSRRL